MQPISTIFRVITTIVLLISCIHCCLGQTHVAFHLVGSHAVQKNKYVEFSQGISPELQISKTCYDKLSLSFGVQNTFWRNTNSYVKSMRTKLLEVKIGLTHKRQNFRLFYQMGFDFSMNDIRFDPSATPEFFQGYQKNYHWNAFCLAPQIELEHEKGYVARLGYRHFIGTYEIRTLILPSYNFGFLEVSIGYRFKLKKKGETE